MQWTSLGNIIPFNSGKLSKKKKFIFNK
jgi:hypothetical protein